MHAIDAPQITSHAERYLLSAIFSDPGRVWEVRMTVRVDDFEFGPNAVVYEAMLAVADDSKIVSPVTVADTLSRKGGAHAQQVHYVYTLDDANVRGVQAAEFARIVRENGKVRRTREEAEALIELANNPGDADVIAAAEAMAARLRGEELSDTRPIVEALPDLMNEMRLSQPYTSTPWPSLNAMIGGVRPGAMYTVAAGSGQGKSIFGLQIAAHVAERGQRVGYVSLEMSESVLLKRMLSMMLGIHQTALNNHALTEEAWVQVAGAETALRGIRLEVWDRAQSTLSDIAGWARSLARKGDLGMIVIDYLGLLESPKGTKAAERSAILNQYANGLKRLANELGIAVVVLEQLNRDAAGRASSRPVITDIRGTAALEHAADVVVLLYRPQRKFNGMMQTSKDIEMIVAKNRQGEAGSRKFYFDGKHSRILQSEYETTPLIEPQEV